MESTVPLIINVCVMVTYCTGAIFCYYKYRSYLDVFMKSNMIIYFCAFIVKPLYWLACYLLYLHYKVAIRERESSLLHPISDSIGDLMSGICFLIIHVT